MGRFLAGIAALTACACMLAGGAQSRSLTTHVFTVTTTADTVDNVTGDGICADSGGQCSLRAAVQEANAEGGTNEIDLPAGTYSLTQGQLQLSVTVALLGAGARTTTIKQTGGYRVLEVDGGTVALSGVTITGGSESSGGSDPHPGVGGGVYVAGGASLSLTRSTVSGNTAYVSGGGIDSNGTLTVDHSTISGNDALGTSYGIGGGIDDFGSSLSISDSTISGNYAGTNGGGILAASATVLTNDTIAGNDADGDGAGVYVYGGADVVTLNTLLAANSLHDCNASLDSHGYNLADDSTCGLAGTNDQQGVDPQLGSLQDNGGPTDTQLPAATSPALDAGLDGACPTDDQRGTVRPQGAHCDIGAVEVAVTPASYALTVAVSGNGTVSNGSSISCPGSCSASFTAGTVVTLTATPASGQLFSGWSGACSGTGTCSVTMSAAASVTATFSSPPSSAPPSSPPATESPSVGISVSAAPTAGSSTTFAATLAHSSATYVDYAWAFGDGTPTRTASATVGHRYQHPGTYTVTVTATDASTDATIASASTTVTVAQAPPHISLSVNPVIPTAGTPANFLFGIASGQALPVTVHWTFGDGSTSSGTTHSTSHTYAAAGTFTATVTETDTAGETLTATLSVVVAPHAIGPPDPNLSTVVADPPGALTATPFGSGGTIKSTIYVTLLDQWRRPVSGVRVGLLGDSTSVTFPGGKSKGTDAHGQAEFTVEDGKAETVHFSATDITDSVSIVQTAAVAFGPEATKVAVAVNPASLPGDGVAHATVTVTLTDNAGHPAPANDVQLVLHRTAGIATASAGSSQTTDANGVATFAVGAHKAGTFSVAVYDKTDGRTLTPSPHATVSFTAAPGGPADAANSTIVVDTQSVPADGTSKATITVTLLNAAGGAAPGRTVTLHTSNGGVHPSAKAATTDANGVATFTATATAAATATFTADDLSDSLTLGPTPAVSFYVHVPDASASSIVTSPSAEPDDGTSASLVTVTLRDLGGAVTPGDLVLLAASGHATVTAVSSIADAHGVATFRVADATPETVTLSAQVPAAQITFGGTTIVFGAHETNATRSSVHASPTSVVDDGHAKTAITVTLVDSLGSPVVGHHVTVVANGGHSSTPAGSTFGDSWGLPAGTTDHNGTVTVEFVDSHDETVTYSAVDDTIGMTLSKTATVAFSPRASAATSTISASPVSVPPGGSSTVTVTLRDVNGEPVIGRHVNIYGTDVAGGKGAAVQIAGRTTDASGSATFLLKRSGGTQLSLTAEVPADGVVVKPHPSLVVSFAAPTGGTVDTSRSTVSASPSDARAASGSSTVTVTLRNSQNGAVSGKSVSLHAATGHSSISPASATTDANGVATFTVSDATVEAATYSAVDTTDSLTPAATATVDFYGHTPDPQTSFITATPAKVADDGSSSSTVKVTLEDLGGAAVSGKRVVLHATGSATITPLAATTSSSGVATFHVTDEVPETVTLTAVDSFDRITLASPSYVRFVAFPSATLSTLVADHTNVASNGKAVVTVTATLLDARGRSVPGTLVDLIPLSGHSNVKRVTGNQNSVAGNTLGGGAAAITTGTATNAFAITDTTAETVTYEAIDEADGITLAQTVTVAFSPPADPSHSFISVSSPTIPADRTTPATVTVTFETSSGAPAVGKEVELVLSGSGSLKVDGGADGITDANGTVTYTVTGFLAGTKTLVAVDHSDAWLHGHVTVAVETPPAQLTIG